MAPTAVGRWWSDVGCSLLFYPLGQLRGNLSRYGLLGFVILLILPITLQRVVTRTRLRCSLWSGACVTKEVPTIPR